jgi:hypothetical protein
MPEIVRRITEVNHVQHSLRRRERWRRLALLVRYTLLAAASDVAIHALFATLAADLAVQICTGLAEPHIIAFVGSLRQWRECLKVPGIDCSLHHRALRTVWGKIIVVDNEWNATAGPTALRFARNDSHRALLDCV